MYFSASIGKHTFDNVGGRGFCWASTIVPAGHATGIGVGVGVQLYFRSNYNFINIFYNILSSRLDITRKITLHLYKTVPLFPTKAIKASLLQKIGKMLINNGFNKKST